MCIELPQAVDKQKIPYEHAYDQGCKQTEARHGAVRVLIVLSEQNFGFAKAAIDRIWQIQGLDTVLAGAHT